MGKLYEQILLIVTLCAFFAGKCVECEEPPDNLVLNLTCNNCTERKVSDFFQSVYELAKEANNGSQQPNNLSSLPTIFNSTNIFFQFPTKIEEPHIFSERAIEFLCSLIPLMGLIYLFRELTDLTGKRDAKKKFNQMKKRLGLDKVKLTDHEIVIASRIVIAEDLKVGWKDVAGLDSVIDELKTVSYSVLAQRKVLRINRRIQPPKGILLHGPPGCGKTLIAKAMAKEARCMFINLDISALAEKWYGEAEKHTSAVFSLAEKIQPCIIFIDEIDTLLRKRTGYEHEVTRSMKSLFMTLWDGLITDSEKTVIVIGATNRPEDLDEAFVRRMGAKFHVPLPGFIQRICILDLALKNEEAENEVNLEALAEMTEGFSGSDIKEVIRGAHLICLNELRLTCERLEKGIKPETSKRGAGDAGLPPPAKPPPHSALVFFKSLFRSFSNVKNNQVDSKEMTLRNISMKDLEISVRKVKLGKDHCKGQTFV